MSSPRPRVVFLDFDGTYADGGVVPDAHVEAVRRAREAGHRVLLCTGRPESILPARITEPFDGYVTSAGARVRIGDEVLCDHRFPAELAARSVDVLERHGASYVLESPTAMYCPPGSIERVRASVQSLGLAADDILAALVTPADPRACSFAKISVWDSPVAVDDLAADIGAGVRPLPNSVTHDAGSSGELQLADVDKADGVAVVAERLGIPMADTVGAGDGSNDIGMLQAVGTAIGIEGSPPTVLAHADLVVPGPSRHGLVEAFARIGLIPGGDAAAA